VVLTSKKRKNISGISIGNKNKNVHVYNNNQSHENSRDNSRNVLYNYVSIRQEAVSNIFSRKVILAIL
jgi:hypothetical protein